MLKYVYNIDDVRECIGETGERAISSFSRYIMRTLGGKQNGHRGKTVV